MLANTESMIHGSKPTTKDLRRKHVHFQTDTACWRTDDKVSERMYIPVIPSEIVGNFEKISAWTAVVKYIHSSRSSRLQNLCSTHIWRRHTQVHTQVGMRTSAIMVLRYCVH